MRRWVNGEELDLSPDSAEVNAQADRLRVRGTDGTHSAVTVRLGEATHVSYRGRTYVVERVARRKKGGSGGDNGELRAPMPGSVVDVRVQEGESVTKGQKLVVLEAMKTQQTFVAPFDGIVRQVAVATGQQVSENAILIVVVANDNG